MQSIFHPSGLSGLSIFFIQQIPYSGKEAHIKNDMMPIDGKNPYFFFSTIRNNIASGLVEGLLIKSEIKKFRYKFYGSGNLL